MKMCLRCALFMPLRDYYSDRTEGHNEDNTSVFHKINGLIETILMITNSIPFEDGIRQTSLNHPGYLQLRQWCSSYCRFIVHKWHFLWQNTFIKFAEMRIHIKFKELRKWLLIFQQLGFRPVRTENVNFWQSTFPYFMTAVCGWSSSHMFDVLQWSFLSINLLMLILLQ